MERNLTQIRLFSFNVKTVHVGRWFVRYDWQNKLIKKLKLVAFGIPFMIVS